MKKLFICNTLLLIFISVFAQNKTLSLKQCVDTALANNLELKQSELSMERAGINWRQAKANLLPGINGSAAHGINQGRSIDPFTNSYIDQRVNYASYGLNASVPLFYGLNLQHTIRQNSLAYDASKMDMRQVRDNLTLNVILAYLQALSSADLLVQSGNQVAVSKKQVERLEAMDKEGAISPSLLSDLQGEQAGNELAVISNQTAFETSKLDLFRLMNIEYDEKLTIQPLNPDDLILDYPASAHDIYEKALEELGLVKAANLRKQSAAKGVQAAKGLLYPYLSLNGNVNTNYSSVASQNILLNTTEQASDNYIIIDGVKTPVVGPKNNFRSDKIQFNKQLNNNLYNTVSLNLNIPIFNSFNTRSRIKLAGIELKNTQYVVESTKIQLRQSIELAFLNMTAARNRYKTTIAQVEAFSTSFRAAEVRFNAGVGTVVDYIIAKNNADRANINLIIARYDFILRAKILDYYQGKTLW